MTEQDNKSNNLDNEENSKDENERVDRPSGTRTAEDSTGINPEDVEPIDEDMPSMPPA